MVLLIILLVIIVLMGQASVVGVWTNVGTNNPDIYSEVELPVREENDQQFVADTSSKPAS